MGKKDFVLTNYGWGFRLFSSSLLFYTHNVSADYNNKNEENSSNTPSDRNYQGSSQISGPRISIYLSIYLSY